MRHAGVVRAVRAEAVSTAGSGWLWTLFVPVALGLPLTITFVIACVAERFATIPGQRYVQEVSTANSAYWVITITVLTVGIAAAYGHAHEISCGAAQFVRHALPWRGAVFTGKWVFYGVLGACTAAVALIAVLVGLPLISASVYGQVALGDPVGLRLLWTVPILAFFAAALGVGVGALVRTPPLAIGAILLWVYVIETAVGYLPGGYSAQRFMPFLNGVYATGQDIVLTPPWGPDAALGYTCGVFILIFLCGMWSAPDKKVVNR
uniref:ABC transporter permease n=1 Tax=Mycobacterium sp. (strain JLS) TaxID=164757 RepID=A0A5Q5CLB9_MYCSJ